MCTVVADIEFDDVQVQIGSKRLLDGVTLRIPKGQRVALIGPSGAGKTTLLRLISGIIWPTAGQVRVLQQVIGSLHGKVLYKFRRRVGYLHQQQNLVPQLRVAHNVLMGRLGSWSLWQAIWSLLRPRELDRAQEALDRLELGDRRVEGVDSDDLVVPAFLKEPDIRTTGQRK